jgi:hypothetical protein
MPFAALLCGMQPDWLARRVTLSEQRMDRVEVRIDSMHTDMNRRFDAVEQALISLQTQITDLHRHMRVLHEDVIDRISKINRG